jgi:alpha-D-ribose 1-methylphosphonate 5-triphosphate synthase subunit PhnI
MNKIVTAFVKGLALSCACVASAAHAGDDLNLINADVEKQAARIDQNYGVLLDTQERNNLKMALIVKKVTADDTDRTVIEKAKAAVVTYEITDPVEQRKLLVELDAAAEKKQGTGHGGEVPDYP